MWNETLCLGTGINAALDVTDELRLYRKAGFGGFFTGWYEGAPVAEWRKTGSELKMEYQSIHAPFGKVNTVWQESSEGDHMIRTLMDCLHSCSENEVPIMICHAFIGFKDHTPTQIGVDRFGTLVKEAEKEGVRVAFENTEGIEYLNRLMDAFIGNRAVGFCWDTGHEMCYNESQDMLARFGDRLIATHLNDNLGIRDRDAGITWLDDLHLLPMDGIADWTNIAQRIASTAFEGPLTFELSITSKPDRHENDRYAAMPFEEYLAECFRRAAQVTEQLRFARKKR